MSKSERKPDRFEERPPLGRGALHNGTELNTKSTSRSTRSTKNARFIPSFCGFCAPTCASCAPFPFRWAKPGRGKYPAGKSLSRLSRKILAVVSAIFSLAAMTSVPLTAHHGTGGTYDMEKPIILKGMITAFNL
jgi:hypothetical protein